MDPLLLLLLGISIALAWHNRFFQDDGYISLRYAENLIRGHGLVFNPGERVEGYTNFLWTAILALPVALNVDPVRFSYVVGMGLFAATLIVTCRVAVLITNNRTVGLIAVLLLGTNYSFSSYATGGLETQLYVLLVMLGLWCVVGALLGQPWTPTRIVLLSLTCSAALLTRLDSSLLLAPVGVIALATLWTDRSPGRVVRVTLLLAPGTAIIGSWLLWKLHYYGGILPNTYYVKATSHAWTLRGPFYVVSFLASYGLILPLALSPLLLRRLRVEAGWRVVFLLTVPVLLWVGYVMRIGGDFMEFRMLMPIAPILMCLNAGVIVLVISRRPLAGAVIALLLGLSLLHAYAFDRSPLVRGTLSIATLKAPGQTGDWRAVGEVLGETLKGSGAYIAVVPAGAIPYYSRLRTLDMLGLSEPWVAQHGARLSDRIGHYRIATVAYLRAQGVHLVVGQPVYAEERKTPSAYRVSDGPLAQMFARQPIPDPAALPADTRVIEIPLPDGRRLLALYLKPLPAVDRAIAQCGWRVVSLDGTERASGQTARH